MMRACTIVTRFRFVHRKKMKNECIYGSSREEGKTRVKVSQVAAGTFRDGSDDDRRRILAALGPNWVVTDGKAAPVLHSTRIPLTNVPSIAASMRAQGPNRLPPPESLLNQRKSARRRNPRDRALLHWWACLDSNQGPSHYQCDALTT